MKRIIWVLMSLLLLGCTQVQKTNINDEKLQVVDMKTYSLDSFIAGQKEQINTDLEVTIDGNEIISQEGNKKCVYYQLLDHTQFSDGGERQTTTKITEEPFYLNIGKETQIEIEPTSELRLFVSPYLLNEIKKESETTQTRLYCLEKGKKYYVRIEPKSLAYGAPLPDGTRSTSKKIFVKISDKPFNAGEPQVEESPVFKFYIYG